jgi:mannitol-1-phosphate 5-dehydrogenase
MASRHVLIYGAGAIGRGYLPWVFHPDDYRFTFVESDPRIRGLLNQQGSYSTFMVVDGGYRELRVPVDGCLAPGEELGESLRPDVIATAVGPRNFLSLREALGKAQAPVICCENDSSLPGQMRAMTGNRDIYFAVPDVITSSTAPEELLRVDPLSIVTESGVCYVEDGAGPLVLNGLLVSAEEMRSQWAAKLYIHNTPHCIAAYLGDVAGVKFVHEAMERTEIAGIVEGAMKEVAAAAQVKHGLDADFVSFYRDKELARFRNTLLFDPVSRVAREPFRKLAPNERLLGAAQMCLTAGVQPDQLLLGIMAAFTFSRDGDPDAHIALLRRSLDPRDFLSTILRLREGESLFNLLLERWESNLSRLEAIR